MLTPHVSTLNTIAVRPDVAAAIAKDPATYLGAVGTTVGAFAEDLSGWQWTLREKHGPDPYAESLRQDALGAARLNVENWAVIARRVVAFGHFQPVRALFRRTRTTMFWAFAMVALRVGPSRSPAPVGPVLPDQAGMPAQQGPRGDDQAQLSEAAAGPQSGQRARPARSAHDSLGVLTWRWSTATWWRRMRISASLARSERASNASQPNTRSTAR